MFSATSAPQADDGVKDVSISNFKADVLESSKTALVLVDFSVPRDPSCKQLTATLEKLVRASKGTVKLAKADIDKNQAIAQQLGVQSVPSVFAFYQGRPVDAFGGVMPEAQVKTWLDQLIKTTGAAGAEKAGLETAFQQAADFLAMKDTATARAIYADIMDMEPENAQAYAGLVRCFLDENEIAHAREMLNNAPPAIAKDKALDAVRAATELAEQAQQGAGQLTELEAALARNAADHQARLDLALALYGVGRREEAVDHLLHIVKAARSWNEEAARKQLVKFFEAMGPMDPLTIAARKRLSSILFS